MVSGYRTNYYKYLLAIAFAWICPTALWWATIAQPNDRDFNLRTDEILQNGKQTVTEFEAEFGAVPTNLSMLRSFAKLSHESFAPYDTNNQRLDYIRFDDSHYLLRSFGKDGYQNHGKSSDDRMIGRVIAVPKYPYMDTKQNSLRINAFDSALLLGSVSMDKRWYAQLYVDKLTGAKRLVTRDLRRKNHYLIAYHDGIEEFYLLPGTQKIIFTATSSGRYQDGLFLWDLETDTTLDILKAAKTFSPNISALIGDIERLHLSLLKLDTQSNKLYFLMFPNLYKPLSPFLWIGMSSIFTLDLGTISGKSPRPLIQEYIPDETYSVMKAFWKSSDFPKVGTLTQKKFSRVRGKNLQKRLELWSSFVKSYYHTPVSGYATWRWIIDLLEAYSDERYKTVKNQIISNLKQLSELLARDRVAPSYLRSLAHYVYVNVEAGRIDWLLNQP